MSFGKWKSITVGKMFPDLNVNDGNSMIDVAKNQVDSAFEEVNKKKQMLDNLKGEVDGLFAATNEARNKVAGLFNKLSNIKDSVLNTGVHVNTVSGIGKDNFQQNLASSLNINKSQDPDVPSINEQTAVGSILIVATSPAVLKYDDETGESYYDYDEARNKVMNQLNGIKSILGGLED